MREYAINYTGGDIRFSTFAAIVVAVPIAEMFCILGQTLVPPLSRPPIIGSSTPCAACGYACADSNVPTEEADDAPFLDLEKGPSRHTTVPVPAPAPEDATRRAAIEAALDMDAARIAKCIVRVRTRISIDRNMIYIPMFIYREENIAMELIFF